LEVDPRKKLEESYHYCRDLARSKAKNFYYSFIFLPIKQRKAIYALYAFCQYGDQIVDEAQPGINPRAKLSEFRGELMRCIQGVANRPLFYALYDAIKRYDMPPRHFFSLIDGMSMDLSKKRYDTFEELRDYCYKVASTVGLLCVEIFGYEDEAVLEYAENLGIALQLTNIIRDIREDAERDRIYIPLEDLDNHGYSEDELINGVVNDNYINLMEFQYDRAVVFYRMAEEALPFRERKAQIASEIMKVIYREILEDIRKLNFRVMDNKVRLKTSRKIILALKTYLKIKLGR